MLLGFLGWFIFRLLFDLFIVAKTIGFFVIIKSLLFVFYHHFHSSTELYLIPFNSLSNSILFEDFIN